MNSLANTWTTYSFDSTEIVQILNQLVQILKDIDVDIRDKKQLKAGFEKLFNIQYCNIPNLDTSSYILAPNHVSDFDALIMGLVHDNIKIMSKSAWVENEKLSAFLNINYNLIGVDRTSKISQAKALVELIKYLGSPLQTNHALIFPQGTISDINKNSIERVQSGIFTLSNKSATPVLPVYIEQPNFNHPTRIVFGSPLPIPQKNEDFRLVWKDAIIALQNSLTPPARPPCLTEKHANNNSPSEPFFS
ncbi:MAG: lysophospholipid acyltransferase family protein [Oscillospiraceae bacterium]